MNHFYGSHETESSQCSKLFYMSHLEAGKSQRHYRAVVIMIIDVCRYRNDGDAIRAAAADPRYHYQLASSLHGTY